jgi:hypothetical protein
MIQSLFVISGRLFASEPFAVAPGGKNVTGRVSPLADLTQGGIVRLCAVIRQGFYGLARDLTLIST